MTESAVAVIGNGPVGQSAALLLARWGVPVVLLDRRDRRDHVGSKAICQQRDVLDIWDSVGAGAAIAAEGVTWTTARTYYRGEELFNVEFRDRGRSPFPPWVNISQTRTEQILDERIAEQPLITVRWGRDVVALSQDPTSVEVTCADGSSLRAGYVVGCAGARTSLRELLGVEFPGQTFDDQFLICDIRADLPGWASERRFYFDPEWNPGRQVLIHPCPDSTYRIDWQVPGDFDLAQERATGRLDERIRRIVGDTSYEILWATAYRFHARLADRFRIGRVLLAGDCAHLVAPFGARGLNSGVQDAENAAWKIAFVLLGWADEALLETYESERRAAAAENLDVTQATMRFLAPQTTQERARRSSVLERAAVDPAARAQVDSGRLAEPFWYVDSELTTPDPRRPFGGRPEKGHAPAPGPGVLVPDVPVVVAGKATRLRDLARAALLLLVGSDVDAERVGAAVSSAPPAPVNVVRVADIDVDGGVTAALGMRADEVWLLRPDAHVAAVLADPASVAVAVAIRRAIAWAV